MNQAVCPQHAPPQMPCLWAAIEDLEGLIQTVSNTVAAIFDKLELREEETPQPEGDRSITTLLQKRTLMVRQSHGILYDAHCRLKIILEELQEI